MLFDSIVTVTAFAKFIATDDAVYWPERKKQNVPQHFFCNSSSLIFKTMLT
jgi:hypothetical protein